MAKHSKISLIDDLIELASVLPWMAGVAIAGVAYLSLHYVATIPAAPPLNDMGTYASRQIYVSAACFMQYIVPIVFLIGAGVSAYTNRHRAQLTDEQSGVEHSALPVTAEPKPYNSRPSCPRCGNPMVEHVAKMGANAGKQFWGCPSFPECKGVRW